MECPQDRSWFVSLGKCSDAPPYHRPVEQVSSYIYCRCRAHENGSGFWEISGKKKVLCMYAVEVARGGRYGIAPSLLHQNNRKSANMYVTKIFATYLPLFTACLLSRK